MIEVVAAFTGFSVDELDKAKEFYTNTLGLKLKDEEMGLHFELPGGGELFVYQKDNHQPATYTVLNFVVENIDQAVENLKSQGVKLEIYEDSHQDEKGIARGKEAGMGPDIAWFKDPASNILAVIQE